MHACRAGLMGAGMALLSGAAAAMGSAHYAMPVGATVTGGGFMASASYHQTGTLPPPEAPGSSASASQINYAGLLGFLRGIPARAPDPPTLLRLVSGNGQIRVMFLPPVYNGGADITLYTATCRPSGGTDIFGYGTSSPVIVNGLINGTNYTCSLTAGNSAGTSTSSATLAKVVRPISIAPILTIILD